MCESGRLDDPSPAKPEIRGTGQLGKRIGGGAKSEGRGNPDLRTTAPRKHARFGATRKSIAGMAKQRGHRGDPTNRSPGLLKDARYGATRRRSDRQTRLDARRPGQPGRRASEGRRDDAWSEDLQWHPESARSRKVSGAFTFCEQMSEHWAQVSKAQWPSAGAKVIRSAMQPAALPPSRQRPSSGRICRAGRRATRRPDRRSNL